MTSWLDGRTASESSKHAYTHPVHGQPKHSIHVYNKSPCICSTAWEIAFRIASAKKSGASPKYLANSDQDADYSRHDLGLVVSIQAQLKRETREGSAQVVELQDRCQQLHSQLQQAEKVRATPAMTAQWFRHGHTLSNRILQSTHDYCSLSSARLLLLVDIPTFVHGQAHWMSITNHVQCLWAGHVHLLTSDMPTPPLLQTAEEERRKASKSLREAKAAADAEMLKAKQALAAAEQQRQETVRQCEADGHRGGVKVAQAGRALKAAKQEAADAHKEAKVSCKLCNAGNAAVDHPTSGRCSCGG